MRVIGGTAKSLPLKSVPGMETRPTTDRIKETLFNMMNPYLPGAYFLDLFAGTGAIGIEALSRGAREAVFVDQAKEAVSCIRENLKFTRMEDWSTVYQCDVSAAISRLEACTKEPFTVVFMDPPYGKGMETEALRLLKNSPLISEDTVLIYEARIEDSTSFVEELGYQLLKEKKYKTNKHVWVKK